jgi:dihydropyrimidinase
MSDTVLIRGGDVVAPTGLSRSDLRLVDGRIAAVELSLKPEGGETVIDADGLLILPGIIDGHTHFELDTGKMKTLDDFESGSASAAAGGVTTYINFAPQQKRQSLVEAVRFEQEKANGHSVVDYALHLSFGTPGANWESELAQVVEMGVTSAKIYTTYTDTIYYTRDWDWYRLMNRSGQAGMLVMVHAENDDVLKGGTEELLAQGKRSFQYHAASRPEVAEVEAVARGLVFCRDTGSPIYFVHLSSPESVSLVAEARLQGFPAFAEVCAHHLSLDDSVYATDQAPRFVMTPPLRSRATAQRLVEQVRDGLVDASGSDHCGYGLGQRGSDRDFSAASPGIPGAETLWPVLYTTLVAEGGMPLTSVLSLVTAGPARIFGIWPTKGAIQPGSDADIVLYDPNPKIPLDEQNLHSKAAFSPWNGRTLQGKVVRTLSRGRTVYLDGNVTGDACHGRFVTCARFDLARARGETESAAPAPAHHR